MSVEAILRDLRAEKRKLENEISFAMNTARRNSYDDYDRGYLSCLEEVISKLEKEPSTPKEILATEDLIENLTEAISKGVAEALRNESYRKKREEADAKWAASLTPSDFH